MGRRFKRTDDFQSRYDKFLESMEYINDKYGKFFVIKESETGHFDSIEFHIDVNTSGVTNMVSISFHPRNYLPIDIKNDVIGLFSENFKN